MQTVTPLSLYQQALGSGEYQSDDVQRKAINSLNRVQQALITMPARTDVVDITLFSKLKKWLGKKPFNLQVPVRGLYMWGGVGRGKTWLMDLFFQSIPGERKLRLHFHHFMLRIHEELTQLQGQSDPLQIIANRFKLQTDIICFDEFFVSDITDAMLLGILIEALFTRGISLVATSNIPPDELYKNGLQRARFLPTIELVKRHCEIMNVDTGIDYRLRALTSAHLWIHPLNAQNMCEMDCMFAALTGVVRDAAEHPVLEINHRALPTVGMVGGVVAIDFFILCDEPRSQYDYIELSRRFHSVLLFNVPVMNEQCEDQARRFLALVDEFYECRIKLVVTAERSFFEIYQGKQLKFEYQRCLSRLQEMQSEVYLQLPSLFLVNDKKTVVMPPIS